MNGKIKIPKNINLRIRAKKETVVKVARNSITKRRQWKRKEKSHFIKLLFDNGKWITSEWKLSFQIILGNKSAEFSQLAMCKRDWKFRVTHQKIQFWNRDNHKTCIPNCYFMDVKHCISSGLHNPLNTRRDRHKGKQFFPFWKQNCWWCTLF